MAWQCNSFPCTCILIFWHIFNFPCRFRTLNNSSKIPTIHNPTVHTNYNVSKFNPSNLLDHIRQYIIIILAYSNTYVNHWEITSKIVSVEDPRMVGGGNVLKQKIWNAARDTIQEWTGQRLAECSLYGIRIYEEGAVLATHVDRNPLVSSAIINVDQDVDEPWPLEVIGHDGHAYNVTMVCTIIIVCSVLS